MKTTIALSLLGNLWEIETITQTATTPAGRWQLLQEWLNKNPTWEKQINGWIEITPNEAFDLLKKYVAEQADVPTMILDKFITQSLSDRVIASIQKIQICYKERKESAFNG